MNGFDWNGNGHRDIGDSYIDYELSNGSGGSSGNGGSGDGGNYRAALGYGFLRHLRFRFFCAFFAYHGNANAAQNRDND